MLAARDYASAASAMFGALQALATERAAERPRKPAPLEILERRANEARQRGDKLIRLQMDGVAWCAERRAECPASCWQAQGPCAPDTTAAKRSAALDALALNDADEVAAGSVATATARAAMAREAAPEPVTISHWGMH